MEENKIVEGFQNMFHSMQKSLDDYKEVAKAAAILALISDFTGLELVPMNSEDVRELMDDLNESIDEGISENRDEIIENLPTEEDMKLVEDLREKLRNAFLA